MRNILSLLAVGCAGGGPQEDPVQWYDPGSPYDVQEAMAFTDVNYDFTGDTPLAALPVPDTFQTWFAPADPPPTTDCADWETNPGLPATITGIATILPRYYYKSNGCTSTPGANDEKFYGSFFVQDASGGYFVLGDTKVAHFDAGARITLQVRAVRESYAQLMIPVVDLVEVGDPEPIYFRAVDAGPLGPEHISQVVRVEGTVATSPSTFGELYLDADDGTRHKFSLDSELSRRGVSFPIGTRLQVTGPVLFSYDEYTVIVMRIGQITEL